MKKTNDRRLKVKTEVIFFWTEKTGIDLEVREGMAVRQPYIFRIFLKKTLSTRKKFGLSLKTKWIPIAT